jgi:DNA replication protein DnaC
MIVPRSHEHCLLSTYEWTGVHPPSLKVRIETFLAGVQEGKTPHLLLSGSTGIGKTHVGIGAYRRTVGSISPACIWLNVPQFCDRLQESPGGALWRDYERATRLVVLDDLFGREAVAQDQIVARLLDTAYLNNAALLVTMCDGVQELSARMSRHAITRLLADATIIPMRA